MKRPRAQSEQHDEIDTAVNALPKKEREVILLRFFEDRDYREIAEQLSISEAAARKRVSRGIEKLHSGLRSKLTTGSAMVLVAPASLGETIAATLSSTAAIPLASSAGTTITTALMTKTTASITCATLLVGTLAVVSVDQNQKRKQLSSELTALKQEMTELQKQTTQASDKPTAATSNESETSQQLAANQQTILDLEEQLSSEREKRRLAEEEAATAQELTAGLEDEVVLAFGKVGEIGADFGSIFREARALAEIEKEGQLETDENKKRITRFMVNAAAIGGLSQQIIEFDNNPEEGSKFLSSSYKAVFDLDANTTQKIEQVLASQLAIAKEQELTLPNNPQYKMLEENQTAQESDVEAFFTERRELYGKIRQQVREQIPADKLAEFDRTVEQGGLGFTNLKLNGSPLGFSLGGNQ